MFLNNTNSQNRLFSVGSNIGYQPNYQYNQQSYQQQQQQLVSPNYTAGPQGQVSNSLNPSSISNLSAVQKPQSQSQSLSKPTVFATANAAAFNIGKDNSTVHNNLTSKAANNKPRSGAFASGNFPHLSSNKALLNSNSEENNKLANNNSRSNMKSFGQYLQSENMAKRTQKKNSLSVFNLFRDKEKDFNNANRVEEDKKVDSLNKEYNQSPTENMKKEDAKSEIPQMFLSCQCGSSFQNAVIALKHCIQDHKYQQHKIMHRSLAQLLSFDHSQKSLTPRVNFEAQNSSQLVPSSDTKNFKTDHVNRMPHNNAPNQSHILTERDEGVHKNFDNVSEQSPFLTNKVITNSDFEDETKSETQKSLNKTLLSQSKRIQLYDPNIPSNFVALPKKSKNCSKHVKILKYFASQKECTEPGPPPQILKRLSTFDKLRLLNKTKSQIPDDILDAYTFDQQQQQRSKERQNQNSPNNRSNSSEKPSRRKRSLERYQPQQKNLDTNNQKSKNRRLSEALQRIKATEDFHRSYQQLRKRVEEEDQQANRKIYCCPSCKKEGSQPDIKRHLRVSGHLAGGVYCDHCGRFCVELDDIIQHWEHQREHVRYSGDLYAASEFYESSPVRTLINLDVAPCRIVRPDSNSYRILD